MLRLMIGDAFCVIPVLLFSRICRSTSVCLIHDKRFKFSRICNSAVEKKREFAIPTTGKTSLCAQFLSPCDNGSYKLPYIMLLPNCKFGRTKDTPVRDKIRVQTAQVVLIFRHAQEGHPACSRRSNMQ